MIKKIWYILTLMLVIVFSDGCYEDGSSAINSGAAISSDKKLEDSFDMSEINIDCQLSIENRNGNIIANLIFVNKSKKPFSILKRNLLIEDKMTFSAFKILWNNIEVPYRGRMIKRPAPQQGDYYKLRAGEFVNATVSLGKYYDFAAKGEYIISYMSYNMSPDNRTSFEVESNIITITID